jgi:hypothetical protein
MHQGYKLSPLLSAFIPFLHSFVKTLRDFIVLDGRMMMNLKRVGEEHLWTHQVTIRTLHGGTDMKNETSM